MKIGQVSQRADRAASFLVVLAPRTRTVCLAGRGEAVVELSMSGLLVGRASVAIAKRQYWGTAKAPVGKIVEQSVPSLEQRHPNGGATLQ